MNDVANGCMVQRVSGSIHIWQNTLSLVGDDGIKIDSFTDEKTGASGFKVSLFVSFIGEDGITISESLDDGKDE